MFREDEYVLLSALLHFVFCPRRCALIHTEQEWAENALTTLGTIEHERVDSALATTHGSQRVERSVPLVSHKWGICGVSDVVEYVQTPTGIVITPVEYKHGRPNDYNADVVQLCAQALCLEEMNACNIPRGFLFYRATRRRLEIVFDDTLRRVTQQAIQDTRSLLVSRVLPPAVRAAHCDSCSLHDICLPLPSPTKVSEYNNKHFRSLLADADL